MEFYLDTADVMKVSRFNQSLPLTGVTTNPAILAQSGISVSQMLSEMSAILGENARFHVQVISESVDDMIDEARQLSALPYDIVVKIPASETGMAAIKCLKKENINVLATAIYSVHQGFLAALAGADYLAPYVNRIDNLGANGVAVVADLQQLLNQHKPDCKILAASFKSVGQAMEVMKQGVGAITLPVDVVESMFSHPAVDPALKQFSTQWQGQFGQQLSYQS